MPKICYKEIEFRAGTASVIATANKIIAEYNAQGFRLTLRQLYYQFVSRGLIANKQSEYKRLGSIINDARLAGLVDWYAITDGTRGVQALAHWTDPAEIISAVSRQYRIDKWKRQAVHVEVWIEKDALASVFEPIVNDLDIPLLSCRGYCSQSEMWGSAQRLRGYMADGQEILVLHFGDHDPSGIDMTRDITERLRLFGVNLELQRKALTMEQIRKYRPPPNPAKETDSRCCGYVALYGHKSWELDALEPSVLSNLVRDAVYEVRDIDKWATDQEREDRERDLLKRVSDRWSDVEAFVRT